MRKSEKNMFIKAANIMQEEGLLSCAVRTKNYFVKKIAVSKCRTVEIKDVLFISGCGNDLPHPWRYRVKHQREQLESFGFTTGEVYFPELDIDQVRTYRAFIFFRCPLNDVIDKFVRKAKYLNKIVAYDIDDLVVDTKYTDQIKYVSELPEADKRAYDQGVQNMQKLLKKCDFAITTTGCLKQELFGYIDKVYLNRNTASEEMQRISEDVLKRSSKKEETIKIGYFSGSITHNPDLDLILPVLLKLLNKHNNLRLCLAGELELPKELMTYEDRIIQTPFEDWTKLPERIAEVDINIAPLEDTIFNSAKSENKWVEASLVKVVTVASNIGAFRECISHKETGILCSTPQEWEMELDQLITDRLYREELGDKAYKYCRLKYSTINSAANIAGILKKEMSRNYGFVLPGLEISGGIKVALKHASILQKEGMDVTLIALDTKEKWQEFDGSLFPVISLKNETFMGQIDFAVATMWTTVSFVENYPKIGKRSYLVQNYETDFYRPGDNLRIEANKTYSPSREIKFLTISKWCQEWLFEKYGQTAEYAPNGLDTKQFKSRRRTMEGRLKILIEGDCAVEYKNIDEAFEITNRLDSQKFEIWYMSYNAEPKSAYKVDKFFHKIPYDEVSEVYRKCDILLKTSLLESFSYPPLEMMATGGYVIAVPNGGNVEYLIDGTNCLLYNAGDIQMAVEKINLICEDKTTQDRLYKEGVKTAEGRCWENISKEIKKLYI